MFISISDWEENIKENGENAGTSIFSFFRNVYKSLLLEGHENQGLFGKELKQSHNSMD